MIVRNAGVTMKKITDYLLNGWQYVTTKVSDFTVANNHMINVICLFFMLVFCVFLVAWFCLWYVTGKPDLNVLLAGLDRLVAPSTLAAVKFVAGSYQETKIKQAEIQFIDKNKNGIDDRVEGDVK